MLIKLRKRMVREESGFTLIELLVVMLILGILAAIAIPAFLSQREKGQDSDAKAGVRTVETAAETYAVENDGEYGFAADPAPLVAIEPAVGDVDGLTVNGTADGYTIDVESGSDGVFTLERDSDGAKTRTCTGPAADPTAYTGGCDGGNW